MKTALMMILGMMTSLAANAEVFRYRFFEDSVNEYTPYVLNIDLTGDFNSSSKVKKVILTMLQKNGPEVILFKWDQNLNSVFKFQWKSNNQLVIKQSNSAVSFKPVVKSKISNPWGDTGINPEEKYSFSTSNLVLNLSGSLGDERVEISNDTQEEGCLWGVLKRIN
ncbi:MAG: hypothetical protein V9F03_02010 [Microthrixaceae bacterium]